MYVPFVRDKDLVGCVQKILDIIKNAKNKNIFANGLDPFGAFFDNVAAGGISYNDTPRGTPPAAMCSTSPTSPSSRDSNEMLFTRMAP